MYEVYLEQAAQKDLKGLPGEIFQRIVPVISALAENPRPHGCRKIQGSKGDWRIRIGSYRIIYEVDDKSKLCEYSGSNIEKRHSDNLWKLHLQVLRS